MSKSTTKPMRVYVDDFEIMDGFSKSKKMKIPVLFSYLMEQVIKYDMFEGDWVEELTKVSFHDLLLEADLDYKKGFEVAKYKAELNLKSTLIKEFIKSMPPEEKQNYLKNVLGDPNKDNLLEVLSTQQMYSVNGQKKMFAPGAEGSPRIVGIPPSHIKQCPTGWHILNDPCLACARKKTCKIVLDDRIEWVSEYGTHAEREKLIEESAGRFTK